MFKQIKLQWNFGKMEAHHRNLVPALALAESVYFEQKLPHLTALLNYSLAQLVLANRFLEAAVKVAKLSDNPLFVPFPEGGISCERMNAILRFIETEMTKNRANYEEGPNFNAVNDQWRALVNRYIELRQQVGFS